MGGHDGFTGPVNVWLEPTALKPLIFDIGYHGSTRRLIDAAGVDQGWGIVVASIEKLYQVRNKWDAIGTQVDVAQL